MVWYIHKWKFKSFADENSIRAVLTEKVIRREMNRHTGELIIKILSECVDWLSIIFKEKHKKKDEDSKKKE